MLEEKTVVSMVNSLNTLWESVTDGDSTHVDASLDLEVAFITPSCAPGVLDNPVISSVFCSVSDSKDGVVDISGGILAVLGGVNSSLVVSEVRDNLKGDGDWSVMEDSISHLVFISFSDVDRSSLDLESEGVLLNGTVSVSGEVWIVFLG